VVSIPDITMYETLVRPHEIAQASALPHVDTVAKKLQRLERKREDKRLRQIAASRAHHAEKRKREESLARADATDSSCELEPKRPKTEPDGDIGDMDVDVDELEYPENEEEEEEENKDGGGEAAVPGSTEEVEELASTPPMTASIPAPTSAPATQVLSRHSKEVRGHTSFLTFACLLPAQTLAQEKVSDPSSAQIIKQEHD